ncbi:MAG: hypothetical protein RL173_3041 [Fibrobacterota bacterium]|jgi:hypothetical protein
MFKNCLAILISLAFAAQAATYTKLSDALKQLLPAGQKAFKTKFVLTEAQADAMNAFGKGDFAEGDDFAVYYTKDDKGQVSGVAVEILEILLKWKAYHTWVIGVTPDGKLTGVAVLELTDKYSFPLSGAAFLKQFPGKVPSQMIVGKGMDAISGASESSKLLSASLQRVAYIATQAKLP